MREKREVQYVPVYGDIDDPFTVETYYSEEHPHLIAQDCAEDYHSNHDGWESEWPLEFTVFSNGRTLGTFAVSREAVLEFYAVRVKTETGEAG